MRLGNIVICEEDDSVQLTCDIYIESLNENHCIWLKTSRKYEAYLCTERADAFVILVLPWAMLLGEDIKCELPVTEDVLYGLQRDLIPVLSAHSERWQRIKIVANGASALSNAGKVGTGCSCGVDSMYAIKTNLDTGCKAFDITHLCVFNNLVDTPRNHKIFGKQVAQSAEVAKELNLPMIVCQSNCMEMLPVPVDYNFLNTYAIMFFVFSLQKLFGRYYLGSHPADYNSFTVENADTLDCAYYDLLTLACLSTPTLRLISAGGAVIRNEKVRELAGWEIAQKYLKVCNESEKNCGICGKCRRTIMSLESMGELEDFQRVFDYNYFQENKKEYYYWLLKRHHMSDEYNEASYQSLKNSYIMKEILADSNEFWHNFTFARGIYEDGWMQKCLKAKLHKPVEMTTCVIRIYVSNLTPTNKINIYVEDELCLSKDVCEGMCELEVPVPSKDEFSMKIEFEKSVVPKDENLSEDIRMLSAILSSVSFR